MKTMIEFELNNLKKDDILVYDKANKKWVSYSKDLFLAGVYNLITQQQIEIKDLQNEVNTLKENMSLMAQIVKGEIE